MVKWPHPDGRVTVERIDIKGEMVTVGQNHLQYVHPLLAFFSYSHLKPPLAEVSAHFHSLAHWIALTLYDGTERGHGQTTIAMQRLLEAKDAAVRARLYE